MFNTFGEHLFVCQSLLKERRRPPTGGLREALEESLGKGFHALVPWSGVENDLGAFVTQFLPTLGKRWILLEME